MHIAICFFGITRSLNVTIDSIQRNILDVLTENNIKYTKFIHTYDLSVLTNKRSKEFNCILNTDEYKLLSCEHISITNQEDFLKNLDFDKIKKKGDAWNDNFCSLKNLLCQFNSLNCVTNLWYNANEKYDLILYLRPDLLYDKLCIDDVYKSFNNKIVLVPPDISKLKTYLNDKYAIGPPEYMYTYGTRIKFIDEYLIHRRLHSEEFLCYVLSKYTTFEQKLQMIGVRVRANSLISENDCNLALKPKYQKKDVQNVLRNIFLLKS